MVILLAAKDQKVLITVEIRLAKDALTLASSVRLLLLMWQVEQSELQQVRPKKWIKSLV